MSKPVYQISTNTIISHLEKLRLEPGDIIVVKDAETLHALSGLGKVVNFTVPLVFAPQGIKKLQRQDLLNLLEQLEAPVREPLLPNERTSAPL